jgi:hypothetical protein
MSEMGHEQTSCNVRVTSAIPLKADIHQRGLHVALCQEQHSATTPFRFPNILRGACSCCGLAPEASCRVVTALSPLSYAVSKLRWSESGGRQVLRCLRNIFAAAMPRMRRIQSDDCKILQRMWCGSWPGDAARGNAPLARLKGHNRRTSHSLSALLSNLSSFPRANAKW